VNQVSIAPRAGRIVLLVYVLALMGRASAAQVHDVPKAEGTVWAGVYTDEQARRGELTYRDRCAQCHLENLKGNDQAPALVGDAFLRDWDAKTLREFYGRILSTMPEDDPGSLDEKAVLDIVAYVLQSGGFPAGSKPLASAEEAERIRITRVR
jgi:mono/diheme cytochrome c family protein